MTNHEEYQKAYRHVQPMQTITMEDLEMNQKAYKRGKILSTIGTVAGAIVLTGGACYAANVGGIQETVQLWLHGSQVEVTVEEAEEAGAFTVTYEDEEGLHEFGGGGMSEDENGEMRPITMEEYIEYLQSEIVDVEMKEDGSVWVYAGDTSLDITNMFNICETSIEVNGETIWVHVEKNDVGGYSLQTSKNGPFEAIAQEELDELYEYAFANREDFAEYTMTIDEKETEE